MQRRRIRTTATRGKHLLIVLGYLLGSVGAGYLASAALSGKWVISLWTALEISVWVIAACMALFLSVTVEVFRFERLRTEMIHSGCPIQESSIAQRLTERMRTLPRKKRNILIGEIKELTQNGINQGILIPDVNQDAYLILLADILPQTKETYKATCLLSPTEHINNDKLKEYLGLVAHAVIPEKTRIFIGRDESNEISQSLDDPIAMKEFSRTAFGTKPHYVEHAYIDLETLTNHKLLDVSVFSDYAILDDEIIIKYDKDARELSILRILPDGQKDEDNIPDKGSQYRKIFHKLKDPYSRHRFRIIEPFVEQQKII